MDQFLYNRVPIVPRLIQPQWSSKIAPNNNDREYNGNCYRSEIPWRTSIQPLGIQPRSSTGQHKSNNNYQYEQSLSNSLPSMDNVEISSKQRFQNEIYYQPLKGGERRDQQENFPNYYPFTHTKPEQNLKLDTNHTIGKCFKRLIIIHCTIISLFAITAMAISIYLLIRVTATTSTSTTTATTTSLRWSSTGITIAGITGSPGSASNQLHTPYHLALDSTGSLYIGDSDNHRVQRYLKGASTGTTIAGQNATASNALTNLNYPTGIVLDSTNNIYIADTSNNRVLYWPNGGSSGTQIAGSSSSGSLNNQLDQPYGIVRDSNTGTLYIADTNNNRIMSYASGASNGTLVAGGNGGGTGSTQLFGPRGIYFDSSSNSVIIANFGAHNIVRWTLGQTYWTLVAGITGSFGSSSTQLNSPVGVTLDSMGNVYVADTVNHRIQLFLAGQSNGTTIAGITGLSGSNATLLNTPFSVALDSQRNLYVADMANNRIQQFMTY
ncbi:unnamed protein product [Rotaria sordida]|uniref:NHL repeat containing protein n=1 Tax=Rotaria sordida TaxID=392033 RepID=A0A814ZZN6_9BILA|nr:unnamed protein product [Rotaria sordida]CAF1248432.1 unnamed protein product [Rotaria sordida]